MQKIILLLAACAFSFGAAAKGSGYAGVVNPNSHHISGYVTKNGTYVAPSHATNPNSTKTDNYTHEGNTDSQGCHVDRKTGYKHCLSAQKLLF